MVLVFVDFLCDRVCSCDFVLRVDDVVCWSHGGYRGRI
jgi:hypothetical protein